MSLYLKLLFVSALLAVGFGIFSVFFRYPDSGTIGAEAAKKYIQQIEHEPVQKRREALVRVLARKAGPRVALTLISASSLPKNGETHLLAHIIGEVAYRFYKEKALPLCQDDMFNGCSHGLISAAISDVGIPGVVRMVQACATSNPFQYHMCLHAAGHAFAALAGYNIGAALTECDELIDTHNPAAIHCYNGVFMENALGVHDGILPPQHPSLSTGNLLSPCDSVGDQYKTACYLNQPSWWFSVFGSDTRKTAAYCIHVPLAYQWACADGIGRIIVTTAGEDIAQIQTYCEEMPATMPDMCLRSVAKSSFAVGNEHLPFDICKKTQTPEGKKNCYSDLVTLFAENAYSSQKVHALCQQFDPAFMYLCPAL